MPTRAEHPGGPMAYTARGVADELQISLASVYRLIAEGALPSFRIGRSRRVRRADLVAYVDSLSGGAR